MSETEMEYQKPQIGLSSATAGRPVWHTVRKWLAFENQCHKQNFVQTFCVYINFVLLGWNYGQLGTVFQDLQLVLKTNVKQTSLIFTMNSVGYMVGSLSIGFIYDRMDKLLLLGLVSIASAIGSGIIPWVTNYGVFLAVRLLTGFLNGGLDSGGNAKVVSCWGTGGPQYMQALHFAYAFGGIISPLVTSLFMAPRIHTIQATNTSTMSPYGSIYSTSDLGHTEFITALSVESTTPDEVSGQYGETKIHIAFVITGILTALAGFGFLILYRLGYEHVRPHYRDHSIDKRAHKGRESKLKDYPLMSMMQTTFFIIVLALSLVFYSAVECKYQSFLMPFILMQMNWTKHQCAYAISLLWAFYGLGRFLGIPISRFLTPFKLLVVFMSSTLLFAIVMFVGAYFQIHVLIWITVPLSGWAISVIFPSYLVWTEENVMRISGKMAGYFLFVGALGFLIDPLYIGVLMENLSPLYFVYLQIGEISVSLFLFVLLAMWVKMLKRDRTKAVHYEPALGC